MEHPIIPSWYGVHMCADDESTTRPARVRTEVRDPYITVAIVVRNGAHCILRQLEAVAEQEVPEPFDIVIVDNGSTDGTTDTIRQWCESYGAGNAVALHVYQADAKASIPYARNAALAVARGDIIAWCDADDRVEPQWLKAITRRASTNVVTGRLFLERRDGTIDATAFPDAPRTHPYLPYGGNCSLAFPKNAAIKSGGYDESLPRYGAEDRDICWKLAEHGFPLLYESSAQILYHQGGRRSAFTKILSMNAADIAILLRHPEAAHAESFHINNEAKQLARALIKIPRIISIGNSRDLKDTIREVLNHSGRIYGYYRYHE